MGDASTMSETAVAVNGARATERCQECQGGVIAATDDTSGKPYWYCPRCKLTKPAAERTEAMPAAAEPSPAKLSWDQAARKRLESLLTALAKADDLRTEAERIHAALTAFGVTDLPPLPWVVAPPPRAERERRRYSPLALRHSDVPRTARDAARTEVCVICGVAVDNPHRFTITRAGSVCRWQATCDENRARGAAAETAEDA